MSLPDRPGIRVMVAGVAETISKSLLDEGPMFSDALTTQFRLTLCNSCEFFNSDSGRCSKCGCFMKIKAKIQAAKCPIGKW